jgi:hypothetical protein
MKIDKKYRLQIVGRFIWSIFFLGIVIAGTILANAYGPRDKIYQNDSFDFEMQAPQGYTQWASNQNAILDQHSHTLYSDGKMTVEQNVLWHIAHGFNVTFITDHDNMNNVKDIAAIKQRYATQILIIEGIEWTTQRCHLNILGVKNWTSPIPDYPTDDDIKNMVIEAHNKGGIVTINHIPWSTVTVGMANHPNRAQLLSWGVDYIEIINEYEEDPESYAWCNNTGGFGMITGTDVHGPTRVTGWTGLNVSSFTEEAVMTELRAKRTSIFYNSTGSPDSSISYDNPAFIAVKPLSSIGSMFKGIFWNNALDWTGIGVFAAYFIGVFIFAEFVRVFNRKFWEKMDAKKAAKK